MKLVQLLATLALWGLLATVQVTQRLHAYQITKKYKLPGIIIDLYAFYRLRVRLKNLVNF